MPGGDVIREQCSVYRPDHVVLSIMLRSPHPSTKTAAYAYAHITFMQYRTPRSITEAKMQSKVDELTHSYILSDI